MSKKRIVRHRLGSASDKRHALAPQVVCLVMLQGCSRMSIRPTTQCLCHVEVHCSYVPSSVLCWTYVPASELCAYATLRWSYVVASELCTFVRGCTRRYSCGHKCTCTAPNLTLHVTLYRSQAEENACAFNWPSTDDTSDTWIVQALSLHLVGAVLGMLKIWD